uniref:Ig-like domain-containing protein n=2 Tax=Gadus morhua TaxID=8049 RepID=A0A8C5CJ33_GADMO
MSTVIYRINLSVCLSTVLHSKQYFYTASSGLTTFPEFVVVGMVDGVQINYYDSNTQRVVLKQDWMEQVTREDPDYMERNTGSYLGDQQSFKANIGIAKQRFNQTGKVYGCGWDDEDGTTDGYEQHGYDGEDFISLDLKILTWVAAVPQAVSIKQRWDQNKAELLCLKNYYTQECVDWLKKYLSYGKSTLQRTDRPRVSLLQRSPSSPVVCHATGFYPDRVVVFWRRDGQELHEQVDPGEVLPNHDGTFQVSVDLNLTAVPQEDWGRYECVVQLKGIEDISTPLDPALIRTNWGKTGLHYLFIAVRVVLLSVFSVDLSIYWLWTLSQLISETFHTAAPPRRSTVDVVSLQRQLLEEVRMLRRTQEQLLQVEREKLLVEREKLRLAQAKSD